MEVVRVQAGGGQGEGGGGQGLIDLRLGQPFAEEERPLLRCAGVLHLVRVRARVRVRIRARVISTISNDARVGLEC